LFPRLAPAPPPPSAPPDSAELLAKLQWLMFFRLLMISVLLGATVLFNFDELASLTDPLQFFFLGLVVVVYLCTLLYALLLRVVKNYRLFAHVQLFGDVLLAAALTWGTGGSDSLFAFMFSLTIINGATILYRKGALITATSSALVFILLLVLESAVRSGRISFWSTLEPVAAGERSLFFTGYIHVATFYLVAILASYLAELLRRADRRILAQAADLERERSLHAKIVGSIASGLVSLHQGRITFLNRAALRILGRPEAELLGQPATAVFSGLLLPAGTESPAAPVPAPPPETPSPSPEVLRTRTEERTELTYRRPDGETIRLGYRLGALEPGPGEPPGDERYLLFDDVTRLRQLEEAMRRSQRLASLGELAAGMAHEVRNPLASISGSVQLLSGGERVTAQDRALLEIIQREADRLERLIASFLGFARPSSRGNQLLGLAELIDITLQMFGNDPSLRGGFNLVREPSPELWVRGDPDRLKQVLWNLLANAAQAMIGRQGEIRVGLRQVPGEAAEGWAELRVSDEGEGIPEELQARVFDPFFTTRVRGTGLGLATVARIVDEHGGQLRLVSRPGAGTTVTVLLPAASRPTPRPQEEQA